MNTLKFFLAVSVLTCAQAIGQVQVTRNGDLVHVAIDGKPYGDLVVGPEAPKPYFYPLRSVDGAVITRGFPMESVAGETQDHRHHRGLWIGYINVNGCDFWSNEPDYHQKNSGKIVLQKIIKLQSGRKRGSIHALFDWRDPAGNSLLTEDRTMTFHAGRNVRQLDLDIILTAKAKVVFEDEKDGFLGIRLADGLTAKTGTGRIRNADGAIGMDAVWGKPADWVDYSGMLNGEEIGIAIFDHPGNFRHPTRWHARDYGLFGPNPFGMHGFDQSAPLSPVTLNAGDVLRLRYRILIHSQMTLETISQLYKVYVAQSSRAHHGMSGLADVERIFRSKDDLSGGHSEASIVWNGASLDRFLADPGSFVPGTAMAAPPVTDPEVRRQIIGFLQERSSP